MADRTYIYIDGESHYIRSQDAWRKIHTDAASLDRLIYKGDPDDKLIFVESKAKVFWTRKMNPGALRTYYFTSAAGDDNYLHDVKVRMRNFNLEPIVVHEKSQLDKKRQYLLSTQLLIEKPKGVDISLAVRMLEDSYYGHYETCHLYTSDVDFLPVVQAVRARGKRVFVHGFRDGLSGQSAYLHSCDLFTDLEDMLRNECELV